MNHPLRTFTMMPETTTGINRTEASMGDNRRTCWKYRLHQYRRPLNDHLVREDVSFKIMYCKINIAHQAKKTMSIMAGIFALGLDHMLRGMITDSSRRSLYRS